jgi:Zn-dependent protease with chaperone function
MPSLYQERSANLWRTWFLMIGFFIMVIAIGYAVAWYYQTSVILYVAVAFAFFMNFYSYWFSDRIALSMTGAKPATRAELEGVIAHELSHVRNRDILVMTVAVVLAGFIAIIADLFLRMSFHGGSNRNEKANALFMVIAVVGIVLAPIAAQLIKMAISRRREYLADASGALLTRYPEGLASALQKIANYGAPMQKANHATAHLFIGNPFGVQAGNWVDKLFSTHPPVRDRVKALLGERV